MSVKLDSSDNGYLFQITKVINGEKGIAHEALIYDKDEKEVAEKNPIFKFMFREIKRSSGLLTEEEDKRIFEEIYKISA